MSEFDEEDDEGSADPEGPDAHDRNDSDSSDTEACPYCRRAISEHAEICPYCRNYVSREDAPGNKPKWTVILVAALLVVIVMTWVLSRPNP